MDYATIVSRFEVLFGKQDISNKLAAARQNNAPIILDFSEIETLDPGLSDAFLETPDECFRASDEALKSIHDPALGEDAEPPKTVLRIHGLHESNIVPIKDLRSRHIGTLVAVDGIIKQASEVRPEITAATFECKSCGQRITLLQEEPHLNKPFACTNETCGSRRGFDLVIRKLIDIQRVELEEVPERLEGGAQPRKIGVFLRDDLVDPKFQKKVMPGAKVQVTGILNDAPMKFELGKETKRRDIYVDANYLEPIEMEFSELVVTPEDEKKIKELATNPKIYDLLVKSIAPSIYGYEEVKLAIALQLFGGVRKVRPDKITTRGDIHILLVGDPGSGKSQLLKYVTGLAPKARYVVGKSASGAGITATVVKDEFMRGWALEAGALVLANNGLCAIDELDKMGKEDRSAMHEVMEQQTVTISKANVQATLYARTTILAAANPKFGRFDSYESIPKQIDIPETLMSRFDLIFPVKDIPNKEKDTLLVRHILRLHENPDVQNPPLDSETIKKYIAYAKSRVAPKLTKVSEKEIENFYVGLRSRRTSPEKENVAVPIGARQLEALIRLSEASAKVRLADKITKEDTKRAIDLVTKCLMEVGIDPETGQLDIDRLESGTTSTQRNKIKILLSLVDEMQAEGPERAVLISDVIAAAEDQGIEGADEIIQKLKSSGELFEPKPGYIRKV